jgi:hypothetical protein
MKIEAELQTLYKITVGHNGVCYGCYDPSDEWKKSYYSDNLKELAEKLSIKYYYGLPSIFEFEQVEVIIYNGKRCNYRTIGYYNKYNKNSTSLVEEHEEFQKYWKELEPDRIKMKEIKKLKEERKEKMRQMKKQQQIEEKEKSEYLKLKSKFEKIN